MGIGMPVRRVEDRRFLTGRGRFVDDIAPPNMAFAYVVRSPHAHARIVSVDKTNAQNAPGVIDVLTGTDLVVEKIGELPGGFPDLPEGTQHFRPLRPILATEFVRHVGDCVALIVAETLNQAKDASELLVVEYEILPPLRLCGLPVGGRSKSLAGMLQITLASSSSGGPQGGRSGICPRGKYYKALPSLSSYHGKYPGA